MPLTYSHRFHSGNVGDVWKHSILLAGLDALHTDPRRLWVIDTHAGEGVYGLGSTGEWSEGVARLLPLGNRAPALVQRYLALESSAGTAGPTRRYLGSPALIAAALHPSDVAHLFELEAETYAALTRNIGRDPRLHIARADGPAAALALLPSVPADEQVLVMIDPAWETKSEWQSIPALVAELHRARPRAHLLLWYPIKSHTRPNAMHNQLRHEHVPFLAVEVLTTPLEMRRNRLNGSGLLWVNPPAAMAAPMGTVATFVGEHCATHGFWSTRSVSWC